MSSEKGKGTKEEGNAVAGPSEGSPPLDKVEWLDLSRNVIEAKQSKHMARALESNKLPNLKTLFLHNNAGDIGMRAMLNALQVHSLEELKKLILWNVSSYDQITAAEEGTNTIANAIADNKMPKLETLDLTSSLPKLVSPRSFKTVFRDLRKGSLGAGRCLRYKDIFLGCFATPECYSCRICSIAIHSGNDGLQKIVKALRGRRTRARPPLKVLILRDNHIGDKGVTDLAKLLSQGVLQQLEEVDLQNNPVGEVGAQSIVRAYLENPLLTASVMLDWPDPILRERASAFRDKNIRLEHRLKELGMNMEQDKISTSYVWGPAYKITEEEPHRFLMLCQHDRHDHAVPSQLESAAAVTNPDSTQLTQPEGIPIKQKSFCGTPSRKLVDREYEEWPDRQEEKTVDGPSCCCAVARLVSCGRQQQQGSGDLEMNKHLSNSPRTDGSTTDTASSPHSGEPSAAAEPLSTIQEESTIASKAEESTVAGKGEYRISITPSTGGFIKTAISLQRKRQNEAVEKEKRKRKETEEEKENKKGTRLQKIEGQVEAIVMELLMVADRKPREFLEMFGLRRVVLQDPAGCNYPGYVCDSCHKVQKDNAIVDEDFLTRRRSHAKLVRDTPESSTRSVGSRG